MIYTFKEGISIVFFIIKFLCSIWNFYDIVKNRIKKKDIIKKNR